MKVFLKMNISAQNHNIDIEAEKMRDLEQNAAKVSAILKAIGNDKRILLLCKIVENGEVSAGSLVGIANLSQSAMSQHLGKLRQEGIITYRREGQTLFYRLADENIKELIITLHRLYCDVDV